MPAAPDEAAQEEAGEGEPGWRRSQWGITLVVFIAFFGFNFVMPILPLYVGELGVADVSQAALVTGVMLAISPLLAAFFAPLWGVVADRYGRKRMVQRSLIVFAVASFLMGRVTSVLQLFVLRASIGVFGGFTSMTMAYVVAVAPPARAGAALGMLQAAQVGGVIVGPLCAGLVAGRFGLRAAFTGGAAVILVGLAAVTFLTQDDRRFALRQGAGRGSEGRRPSRAGGLTAGGAGGPSVRATAPDGGALPGAVRRSVVRAGAAPVRVGAGGAGGGRGVALGDDHLPRRGGDGGVGFGAGAPHAGASRSSACCW